MNISSVSIVIPAYNAEKFITRCIASIVKCNFGDYEIIIVNDGSTDSTLNVIKREAEKNNKIKIYSIDNSGVAVARNCGIEHSSKKWITFVDADDYLNSNLIKEVQLNENIWNNNQMVRFDVRYSSSHKESFPESYHDLKPVRYERTNREILMENTLGFVDQKKRLGIRMCVCVSTFYLASFLKSYNIRFPMGVKNGEDMIFSLRCLEHFESMTYISFPFYVYYQNPQSLTHRYKPDMDDITLRFFANLKPIVERNPFLYNQYCLSAINNLFIEMDHYLFHPSNAMSLHIRYSNYRRIISNPIYQKALNKKIDFNFGGLNQLIYKALRKHFYYLVFLIYTLKLIYKITK